MNLSKMTMKQIKQTSEYKNLKLKGKSKLKKVDLILALNQSHEEEIEEKNQDGILEIVKEEGVYNMIIETKEEMEKIEHIEIIDNLKNQLEEQLSKLKRTVYVYSPDNKNNLNSDGKYDFSFDCGLSKNGHTGIKVTKANIKKIKNIITQKYSITDEYWDTENCFYITVKLF